MTGAFDRDRGENRPGRGDPPARPGADEDRAAVAFAGESRQVAQVRLPAAAGRVPAVGRDRQGRNRAPRTSDRATRRQCAAVVPRRRAAPAGSRKLRRRIVAFLRAFSRSWRR